MDLWAGCMVLKIWHGDIGQLAYVSLMSWSLRSGWSRMVPAGMAHLSSLWPLLIQLCPLCLFWGRGSEKERGRYTGPPKAQRGYTVISIAFYRFKQATWPNSKSRAQEINSTS